MDNRNFEGLAETKNERNQFIRTIVKNSREYIKLMLKKKIIKKYNLSIKNVINYILRKFRKMEKSFKLP